MYLFDFAWYALRLLSSFTFQLEQLCFPYLNHFQRERCDFLRGLRLFGRGKWKKISKMIPTRYVLLQEDICPIFTISLAFNLTFLFPHSVESFLEVLSKSRLMHKLFSSGFKEEKTFSLNLTNTSDKIQLQRRRTLQTRSVSLDPTKSVLLQLCCYFVLTKSQAWTRLRPPLRLSRMKPPEWANVYTDQYKRFLLLWMSPNMKSSPDFSLRCSRQRLHERK